MIGGAGNDTYVVDDAGDVVTEAADEGTDTVQVVDQLHAGRQRREPDPDRQRGNRRHWQQAANIITGNSGNNLLDGGTGNDTAVTDPCARRRATSRTSTAVRGERHLHRFIRMPTADFVDTTLPMTADLPAIPCRCPTQRHHRRDRHGTHRSSTSRWHGRRSGFTGLHCGHHGGRRHRHRKYHQRVPATTTS